MNKNCEKNKILKKQNEFNRRKRIQRWMNELRRMIAEDWSLTKSSYVKLDKIELLEYAIKQLQFSNSSFQLGYEKCQAEIALCLDRGTQLIPSSKNTNTSSLTLRINKLDSDERVPNVKMLHDFNADAEAGHKRDVLIKLRQKIIENKRKKCIKQKMNMYSDGGGRVVDEDVWRPW